MKELSLHILDIAQNSVSAGARSVSISLVDGGEGLLTVTVGDDGCGMSAETVARAVNPFYTTRTTRRIGLGIPLFKLAAEQAGGRLIIESTTAEADPEKHGTTVTATFRTDDIDFIPLGDIVSTICTLVQGHPEIEYTYRHSAPGLEVRLETAELREILGEDISLAEPEVIGWLSGYLEGQYKQHNNSEDIQK